MQKFLRVLAVLALMLLPTVAKAQYTVTVADGTSTNNYVPVYGYYADAYLRCQSIYPASMLTAISTGDAIYEMKFYSSNTSVSWGDAEFEVKLGEVTETSLTGFSSAALTSVYTGSLSIDDYGYMTIEFDNAYVYGGGNLMLEITETEPDDYVQAYFYGIDATGASWQGYSYSDISSISGSARDFLAKVTISYGSAPTCLKVSNVTVTGATSSSLSLSWIDTVNTGAGYTIYDMSDTSVVATVASGTTCTVNGLNANTLYTLGVVANCSATENSGFTLVSGRTACADGDCMITIVGTDSYGDGWNGNAINVYYDTTLLDVFTLTSGSYNEQNWCLGGNVPVNFSWISGMYSGEADFDIVGNTGVTLFSANGSELTDGVAFFSLSDACADSVALLQYTFTLSCNPTEGVVTGGGIFMQGDTVTFTATPNTNYVFDSWTLVAVDEYGDSIDSFTASVNPLTFIAKPSTFGTYTDFVCTANFTYYGPVTCSGTSCYLTVVGHDSYGDGWNGGALTILQNDTIVGSMAVADSEGVAVFEVCNDYPVYFYWTSGSWDSEVSFFVTNGMGDTVVSVNGAGDLSGVFAIYSTICTNPTTTHDTAMVTIAVNDATMGTTVPAPGTYYYADNETLSILAIPDSGYTFVDWTVDYYYEGVAYSESLTSIDYDFAMSNLINLAPLTFTANFEPYVAATYTISVNYDSTLGYVTGAGVYNEGDLFTLEAFPNPGYMLARWEVYDADSNYLGWVAQNPWTYVAYSDYIVNAIFDVPDTITVTIAVNDTTMGTTSPVPGTYQYVEGDYCTIDAIPNAGYELVEWAISYYYDGEYETEYVDGNPFDLLVHSGWSELTPLTITAVFGLYTAPTEYTITVVSSDTTMGYVTGSGVYEEYESFTATAYPNPGYHFDRWRVYDGYGDYAGYTQSNPWTYYAYDNYTVVAYFEADPAPVPCSGTSCYITINGEDSWGDGWNGGTLRLMQNNSLVGIMDVYDSAYTQTFEVCNDYPVDLIWNSGSYDGEVSFTILSSTGTTILDMDDVTTLVNGHVFAQITNVCTAPVVTYVHDTVMVTIAVNDATLGTTIPAPGTYYYADNDTLYIEAYPATGYDLLSWTVDYFYDGTPYSEEISGEDLAFLMSNLVDLAPLTFTANFGIYTAPQHYITAMASDSTMGYVTGAGLYDEDDYFTVTAYPYPGYLFVEWEIYDSYGSYLGYSSSNPFTWNADDDYVCVAIFEAEPEPIACAGTSCYITIAGEDSWGDGWNGGTLNLYQNDTLVGIMNVYDSADVKTFELCNDYPVNFVWNAGSWDSEVSFTVLSSTGATLFSVGNAGTLVPGEVFASVSTVCTAPVVTMFHDTVMVTVAVNDATMGTTIPAPGTYTYIESDTLFLTAVPNPGYVLVDWTVDYYYEGTLYSESISGESLGYLVNGLVDLTPLTFTANFELYIPEEVVVTVAVNNPSMGVVTPAPGTYTYIESDTLFLTASPNQGYFFNGWTVDFYYEGEYYSETMESANLGFLVSGLVEYSPLTFTANFSSTPDYDITDTVVCTYSVNDPSMGTTNPAPGTYTYYTGQAMHCVAVPNSGYHLEGWQFSMSYEGELYYDTVLYWPVADFFDIFGGWVIEEGENSIVFNVMAIFAEGEGIEDVEANDFTVIVNESVIKVRGAEGRRVTLFDVNGRMLSTKNNAGENVEFRVDNSGVYLIKVGNAAARRVVVIR